MIGVSGFHLCPCCYLDLREPFRIGGDFLLTRKLLIFECQSCSTRGMFDAVTGELVRVGRPKPIRKTEAPGRQTPRVRNKGNWNLR